MEAGNRRVVTSGWGRGEMGSFDDGFNRVFV